MRIIKESTIWLRHWATEKLKSPVTLKWLDDLTWYLSGLPIQIIIELIAGESNAEDNLRVSMLPKVIGFITVTNMNKKHIKMTIRISTFNFGKKYKI